MQARVDWVLINFGAKVIKKKRTVWPVFPDYLSVSYDYDLTVNGYVKKFMRGKFNAWYYLQIGNQFDAGKQLQDIDVPPRLSLLKPCHAEWLVKCYNHMTTTTAQNVI